MRKQAWTDERHYDLGILMRRGAVLLDVRTHEEFVGWHLRGALNVPVEELDNRLEAIMRWGVPLLVYSGNDQRSETAANKLRLHGLEAYNAGDARSLAGRIQSYSSAFYPQSPQA